MRVFPLFAAAIGILNAQTCTLSVGQTSLAADSLEQNLGLSVTANAPDCSWIATGNGFASVSPPAGAGNGSVSISLPKNTSGVARTASVTIAGTPVSVTQRATATVFADVDPSAFFFDAAGFLRERAITAGCSANPPRYCPNDNITRGQMAVFVTRAIDLVHGQTGRRGWVAVDV